MIGRIAVGELIFTEEDAERARRGEFWLGVGSTAGNKGKSESLKGEGEKIPASVSEDIEGLRGKIERLEKERGAPPEEIDELRKQINSLEEKIPASISVQEQIEGLRGKIKDLEKERGAPPEEINKLNKRIDSLEKRGVAKKGKIVIDGRIAEEKITFKRIR